MQDRLSLGVLRRTERTAMHVVAAEEYWHALIVGTHFTEAFYAVAEALVTAGKDGDLDLDDDPNNSTSDSGREITPPRSQLVDFVYDAASAIQFFDETASTEMKAAEPKWPNDSEEDFYEGV